MEIGSIERKRWEKKMRRLSAQQEEDLRQCFNMKLGVGYAARTAGVSLKAAKARYDAWSKSGKKKV